MYRVNSMKHPPKYEGDYLFYFGDTAAPYFSVETLRFTVEEDLYEMKDWYLEDNVAVPTLWFELPEIGR